MKIRVRDIRRDEYVQLGLIMESVYGNLEGFPGSEEQPAYYEMLRNIGKFSEQASTHVLVALSLTSELLGGIVYFSDMAQYGSGGSAIHEKCAAGIRLLGVRQDVQGTGIGKALTQTCIHRARLSGNKQMILHTTKPMRAAWGMYEKLGFKRSQDLDFTQGGLQVYGFRLSIR